MNRELSERGWGGDTHTERKRERKEGLTLFICTNGGWLRVNQQHKDLLKTRRSRNRGHTFPLFSSPPLNAGSTRVSLAAFKTLDVDYHLLMETQRRVEGDCL